MVTATLEFESISQLPPKENEPPAYWCVAVDRDAVERYGLLIREATHVQRLQSLQKGQPVAFAIGLRRRSAGGYSVNVLDVGLPKDGAK